MAVRTSEGVVSLPGTMRSYLYNVHLFTTLFVANSVGSRPPGTIIRDRHDLPSLPGNCTVYAMYVEEKIEALGPVADMLSTFHSGVAFDAWGCNTGPQQHHHFLVEWAALDFPFGAILPSINGSVLEWKNTAVAFLSDYNASDWTKVHIVGSLSGTQFNAWAQWVLDYCKSNPAYQVWDVWSAPTLEKAMRFFNDTICDSFSQNGSLSDAPALATTPCVAP